MHDLQRLRFVTERYPHLQGLRIIPLGIPFLLSAIWRDGHLDWIPGAAGHGASRWFVVLMALAVLIALGVGRYYREQFGSVESARTARAPVLACAFGAALVGSLWLQDLTFTSISYPALVIGAGIAYVGLSGGQVRPHYLIVAMLTFVFGALGSFHVSLSTRNILLDELFGLGLIIIGVGDHLLLCRAMEPERHVRAI